MGSYRNLKDLTDDQVMPAMKGGDGVRFGSLNTYTASLSEGELEIDGAYMGTIGFDEQERADLRRIMSAIDAG